MDIAQRGGGIHETGSVKGMDITHSNSDMGDVGCRMIR